MEGIDSIIGDRFDILCIAESKLDSSFPKSQFKRKGYKPPYRLDVSKRSGGLMVYIREGISSLPKHWIFMNGLMILVLLLAIRCKTPSHDTLNIQVSLKLNICSMVTLSSSLIQLLKISMKW